MNKLEASDHLRSRLSSLGRSDNTIRGYCADLERFFDWIPDHWVVASYDVSKSSLDDTCARQYINWLRHGTDAPASTVVRKVATIRFWFKMHDKPDPFKDYTLPVRSRPPAHPLAGGRSDLDILIAHAKTMEQRCLIALCGVVGCRVSEARSIRLSSFSVVAGQRYITIRGKGDKTRTVPVADVAWTWVEARLAELRAGYKRGDRLIPADPKLISYSDRGARAVLTRIGDEAGIKVASHDLRMTFGTLVYNATNDIRATQELLGHASIETTVRYTGVADKAMVGAVKGAFA